jgi:hypothetical protein
MAEFEVRLRSTLGMALVAAAAAALIVASPSNAADHGDAPYASVNSLVSAELRPLAGQQARGIVNLRGRPTGRQDSVAAILVDLAPGDRYKLGLTRHTCRELPEVSLFFDIPGVIVADPNGTAFVRKAGLDLTRPGLPPAKSVVLRRTSDADRVACGRLQVFERASPPS